MRVSTRVSAQALRPRAEPPARPGPCARLLDSGSAGAPARKPGRVQTCARQGAEAGSQADPGVFLDVPSLGLSFPTCRMGYRGQGAGKLGRPGVWSLSSLLGHLLAPRGPGIAPTLCLALGARRGRRLSCSHPNSGRAAFRCQPWRALLPPAGARSRPPCGPALWESSRRPPTSGRAEPAGPRLGTSEPGCPPTGGSLGVVVALHPAASPWPCLSRPPSPGSVSTPGLRPPQVLGTYCGPHTEPGRTRCPLLPCRDQRPTCLGWPLGLCLCGGLCLDSLCASAASPCAQRRALVRAPTAAPATHRPCPPWPCGLCLFSSILALALDGSGLLSPGFLVH